MAGLSLILAMAKNQVIGNQGKLPWHIPEDLRRFKKLTLGNPMIMGRKTFDSIGRPLPGRLNIVITSSPEKGRSEDRAAERNFSGQTKLKLVAGFDQAIAHAGEHAPGKEVFVIGGERIFRVALPHADRIYLTLIDREFAGDTIFPWRDFEREFVVVDREPGKECDSIGLPYEFLITERRRGK